MKWPRRKRRPDAEAIAERARAVVENLIPSLVADWQPHDLQGRTGPLPEQLWAEMDRTYDMAVERGIAEATAVEAVRELYAEAWVYAKQVTTRSPERIDPSELLGLGVVIVQDHDPVD